MLYSRMISIVVVCTRQFAEKGNSLGEQRAELVGVERRGLTRAAFASDLDKETFIVGNRNN